MDSEHVLNAEPDLEVVAEAADGAEAIKRALADDIDLAILDISMPRLTGLQAARELAHRRPELRLLILSMYENEQFLYEALKAGASGYVLKSGADDDIVEACRAAMRGEPFLYPSAVNASSATSSSAQTSERDYDPLTPRELEVLKLIAEGSTSKEIAQLLVLSIKTVERHRADILHRARHARPRRSDALRDPPRPGPALTRRNMPLPRSQRRHVSVPHRLSVGRPDRRSWTPDDATATTARLSRALSHRSTTRPGESPHAVRLGVGGNAG